MSAVARGLMSLGCELDGSLGGAEVAEPDLPGE